MGGPGRRPVSRFDPAGGVRAGVRIGIARPGIAQGRAMPAAG